MMIRCALKWSNGFIGCSRGTSLCHECQGKPSSDTKCKVKRVLVAEFKDSWDLLRTGREREREREKELNNFADQLPIIIYNGLAFIQFPFATHCNAIASITN